MQKCLLLTADCELPARMTPVVRLTGRAGTGRRLIVDCRLICSSLFLIEKNFNMVIMNYLFFEIVCPSLF